MTDDFTAALAGVGESDLRVRAAQSARDAAEAKAVAKKQGKELSDLRRLLDRITQIKPADQKVPGWVKPKKNQRKHVATPMLMLSDLHLDEVVNLREMDGLNAYNREIAEARLERVVNGTVDYLHSYTAGVGFDGIVAALLGDIITGDIHEELAKTNESPIPATIVHWVPRLAAGIRHLADEFGRVFVPCVDGNHDRTGKKMPYKQRAEQSYAWIIYNWLASIFESDDRVTFSISQSPEQIIPIYSTNFLLEHGDGPAGGSGIGGIFPPIIRHVTKKQDSYAAMAREEGASGPAAGRHFHYALMGHWHQEVWGPNFIINGSLKGYDEYARGHAFRYERPKQNLFLVTPERGITLRTSIHAE